MSGERLEFRSLQMPTTVQVTIDQAIEKESRTLISAEKFEHLPSPRASHFDSLFSVLSYFAGTIVGLLTLLKLLHYF
jgi:VIT1/CCC1 family predicted Fe2+/Mn2+ transporter